ncbi:response regulator [Halorutilales archaeon Cl-col2-1]
MDDENQGEGNPAKVMVVDDEKDVADLFEALLSQRYDVVKAYGGEEALEKMDDTVNVVFLDRRMPDLSGDEVLENIQEDDSLSPHVVMLTAISPDFDIIEMGFDDYLTKPVDRDDLYDAVENCLERDEYDDKVNEYLSLVNKKTVLEEEKSQEELEQSDEFSNLEDRVDELLGDLDELREGFVEEDEEGFEEEFKRL